MAEAAAVRDEATAEGDAIRDAAEVAAEAGENSDEDAGVEPAEAAA